MSRRIDRVSESLKKEISQIIQEDLKDPRIGFTTITSVDVSKDLRYAKVYLSILGDEEAKKSCLVGLNSAKGHIKQELGKRIRLKFFPDIDFRIDEAIEEGIKISKLIEETRGKESNGEGD